MTGLHVTAQAATPDPTYWAHDCACAWTAGWLTVRGAQDWQGPREVLIDPDLKGTVLWSTSVSPRRAGHTPDLTVGAPAGLIPIEVELQRKNTSRLEGILAMYRHWIDESKIRGVAYVCGSEARADRVGELADKVGIATGELRSELLSVVREEAQRWRSRAAERSGSPGDA